MRAYDRYDGEHETWIDAEELAYPSGSLRQSRRYGQALCADGKLRRVKLGIPDTFFSIPATCRITGVSVSGFVTYTDNVFRFVSHGKHKDASPMVRND